MKRTFTFKKSTAGWYCVMKVMLLVAIALSMQPARAQTFVHPGIPFTRADLDLLKTNIAREPWMSAYNAFANDSHSKLTYVPQGPFVAVSRAPNLNNSQWQQDMIAIHHLAFMWWFTGNEAYAKKATDLLDAWAVTNTNWDGVESMLDIGDYAQYWATGAELLRYTYPGWTQANTDHVKNYFANVLFPTSYVPNPLKDANKGALQLKIALAASVFCDDAVRFNQALDVYRMDAGGGMRNSLPNGEVGDAGRDDHWRVQAAALIWGAEVAYKQRVDMYAELNNRVLAIGELYNRYSVQGDTIKFIPFGGYASFWTNWGIPTGYIQSDYTNILQAAYTLRKGIPTPFNDLMRTKVGGAGGDFLYLKSADTSTAVPLSPVYYPADHILPANNLTTVDIGSPGITGTASVADGTWTLKSAGNSASSNVSYTFKKISGDGGLIVKVTGMSLSTASTGLMIRQSLAAGASYWNVQLAATGGVGPHVQPKMPWWLRIERVGNRIFTYHSPDGVSWTGVGCFYSTSYPADLYYGFYTISNNTSSVNTATLTNVGFSQDAPVGSPEINSATSVSAVAGQSFSYQITASGNPASYSASGLPTGLTLDGTSGIISGTPTSLGTSEIMLNASNGSGTGHITLILKTVSGQAPATPASLVATVVNSSQVRLSWGASANANSYTVKRATTQGGPYAVIQTGVTGTTFTDASPTPEISNYYVVTALAGSLESGASNEVTASVPPAIPNKPTIVNKNNEIDLSWASANGAASYNIKRAGISGGPYITIANVTIPSYNDVVVSNGNPYYYVVSSVGSKSESANSPEAYAVPGSSSLTWNADAETVNWADAPNWVENAVPQNPAILTFKSSADTIITNNINGLEVSRILFDQDAQAYTISGNSFALNNDLVNNSTKVETISTPLTISKQLNVNANTGNIALRGAITGSGSVLKTGQSVLSLAGANTYSGGTVVKGFIPAWPPIAGIAFSGTGAGTPSQPTSGPFGIGKITFNGGGIWSENNDVNLYNDLEIPSGQTGWIFETTNAINLYGKITGSGTLFQDGNTFAGLHLFGDNSGFTGQFVSKLRSGNSRTRFEVPQAGSASADWLLDANATDCQSLQFSSGTINFGSLSGRGFIRNDGNGAPVISIGAKNNDSNYSGSISNAGTGNVQVVKVGTGTLTFSGNSQYGGTTTIKSGKFFLTNSPTIGVFTSPIVDSAGTLGGTGLSQASMTVGTGIQAVTTLEPGVNNIGTLATTGALLLNSNSVYKAEISSKTGTSDIIRAGSIKLAGSPALSVTDINPGALAVGTNLTICDNTGTTVVNGTFKDLPELALVTTGNYKFRITYKGGTGNDIVLLDNRAVSLTITSKLADTVLVDRNYNYAITTTGTPIKFSASGLPTGLNLDTLSGVISGVTNVPGNFPITLIAKDSSAVADTVTLALTVLSKTVTGVMAAAGDSKNIIEWNTIKGLTFTVKRSAVSGGPYAIIGQTSATKFTDNGVSNNSIYYYVVASVDSTVEGPLSTEVSAKPGAGQFGYWKFDESTGTKAVDNWGANHGSLAATANHASGKYGQALFLDGTANAYATLPAGIFTALNDFTVSTWVRMDAISTWMRVFDFGASTTQYMFLTVQAGLSGTNSIIRYGTKNGTAAEQNLSYNFAFPLNTWVYLAVTRAGNTTTIYVNGTAAASSTNITIKPSALGNTTQNYLGKSQFADPMFKGSIDNFKIYSRALSAAEIAADMQGDQTINFAAIPSKTVGDADFAPSASVTSGLPITYSVADTTVAAVVNGNIHIKAVGSTVIMATQPGNVSYKAAVPVNQTLTVNKQAQTITFNALTAKTVADSDFVAGAIASSNLPVSYTSADTTVAQIINGKVHIAGAGTVAITATQSGNAQYLSALPVSQNLTVNKLDQIITFTALPVSRPGDAEISLNASANSGLPVTYTSSNTAVAVIDGNRIQIVGAGSSTITAKQDGNTRYSAATQRQTLNVLPYNVQIQWMDGDNGQLSNNTIRPYFKLVDQDSVAIKYSELSARYWFTAENYTGINTWIDYAQMGSSSVSMKYVQLPNPATGALGYIQYSFQTTATLNAGSNSGVIQSRFANQDWANFAEGDDYSYRSTTGSYSVNDHFTLYRNGVLIYGTEPAISVPNTALTVSYQNQNTSTSGNSISTYVVLNNTGNQPVNYSDLAIHYWFTRETASSLNLSVDYAKLGGNKVSGHFVPVSPALTNADTYLELTIDPSAGTLYPLSNTGNIQYRVNKSDWSVFNEANDFSYMPKSAMTLNNHITVYYKGQLIYGVEPVGSGNNAMAVNTNQPLGIIQNNDPLLNAAQNNVIYPNPVTTGGFSVKLTSDLNEKDVKLIIRDTFGKVMQSGTYHSSNGNLSVLLTKNYMPGVYFVQLNGLAPMRLLVNP